MLQMKRALSLPFLLSFYSEAFAGIVEFHSQLLSPQHLSKNRVEETELNLLNKTVFQFKTKLENALMELDCIVRCAEFSNAQCFTWPSLPTSFVCSCWVAYS